MLYLVVASVPPSGPVSSTARIIAIYSFLEVDDVIPFCLL